MACSTGSGSGRPPFGPAPTLEHALEAHAVDELHDDVAIAVVLDEVVDLHDVRVLDLGEEPTLGECGSHGVLVAVVEEALQHDPPLGHEVVAGEVDPAQAAVGEASDDLVLAADHRPGVSEARNENGVPQERQNPSVRPGRPLRVRPTGSSQRRAEATVLGDRRVGHHRGLRVACRDGRDVDHAGAEAAAADGRRRPRSPGGRRAGLARWCR